MGTTAGGSHDVIERGKVFDEEFFGCLLTVRSTTLLSLLNASQLETREWRILEKQNERIINVRIQKKLDSSAIIFAFQGF
jgi:hypothetical protein